MNKLLTGLWNGQKEFGSDIAFLINVVLLTIVYLLGVGPLSILAKLSGKRFLEMNINKKAKTYWEELNLSKNPIEEYYRQF